MSINTITARMQGRLRSRNSDDRGADLANRFEAMRTSLALTKRAKIAASLLLTVVAAVLGYGYLGPVLSDLISTTALVLLAAATAPLFRGGAADLSADLMLQK